MEQAGTQLTVIQRAQVALNSGEHEKKLIDMAKASEAIVAITNPASYQELHSARTALKRTRVDIEKTGKAAREDAQAFSKAIIAEEKRLIAIIEPEEIRLEIIQTDFDTKAAREKAEKESAEAARLEKIRLTIAFYGEQAAEMIGKPSAEIERVLSEARATDMLEWAQEFKPQAQEARVKAIAALELMLAGTLAQERAAAELAAKQEAERLELERLRAESEARAKADAERQAEIDRQERASRERIAAEQKAANDKMQADLAESRRVEAEERAARKAEMEREQEAERERQRIAREAQEKADAEKRAQERQEQALRDEQTRKLAAEQAERQRVLDAERERQEAAQREIDRQREELLATDRLIGVLADRIKGLPAYAGILRAIVAYQTKTKAAE